MHNILTSPSEYGRLQSMISITNGAIKFLKTTSENINSLYNKSKTLGADILCYVKDKCIVISIENTITFYNVDKVWIGLPYNNNDVLLDNFDLMSVLQKNSNRDKYNAVIRIIMQTLGQYKSTYGRLMFSEKALKENYAVLLAYNGEKRSIKSHGNSMQWCNIVLDPDKCKEYDRIYDEVFRNKRITLGFGEWQVDNYYNVETASEDIKIDTDMRQVMIIDNDLKTVKNKVYTIDLLDITNVNRLNLWIEAFKVESSTINIMINCQDLKEMLNNYEKFNFLLSAKTINISVFDSNNMNKDYGDILKGFEQLKGKGSVFRDNMYLHFKKISITDVRHSTEIVGIHYKFGNKIHNHGDSTLSPVWKLPAFI